MNERLISSISTLYGKISLSIISYGTFKLFFQRRFIFLYKKYFLYTKYVFYILNSFFVHSDTLSHGNNSFLVIREQSASLPGFSAASDRALRGQRYCLVKMKLRVQPSTQYPVPTTGTNIGRKSPRDFIAATENGQFRKPRRARGRKGPWCA